jgi:hypothetical protein
MIQKASGRSRVGIASLQWANLGSPRTFALSTFSSGARAEPSGGRSSAPTTVFVTLRVREREP